MTNFHPRANPQTFSDCQIKFRLLQYINGFLQDLAKA
jgi:hypothetical protein